MADNQKNDPGARMRYMLNSSLPVVRLPQKQGGMDSFLSKLPQRPVKNDTPVSVPAKKVGTAPVALASLPQKTKSESARKFNIGPAFWTIASALSLTINVILVVILLAVLGVLRKANLNNLTVMGPNLLGGLYTNFEKMDRAHITTNIPVSTTIPVKFDLQLNQQTNVVLSQNVTIRNALVTVNTGGLNITRAATTIVLPQGTTLPVFLNLTIPVDTTVPIVLNVAVDIPMEQTQLHEPFVGLRDVVAPLYCLFKSDAVGMNGQPICK